MSQIHLLLQIACDSPFGTPGAAARLYRGMGSAEAGSPGQRSLCPGCLRAANQQPGREREGGECVTEGVHPT